LTRVLVRTSWSERETLLVDARDAELVVFPRWWGFTAEGSGHAELGY